MRRADANDSKLSCSLDRIAKRNIKPLKEDSRIQATNTLFARSRAESALEWLSYSSADRLGNSKHLLVPSINHSSHSINKF